MVGFERTISVGDKSVTLETMALQPLVLSVSNFLSDEECDHVIGGSGSGPNVARLTSTLHVSIYAPSSMGRRS